MEASMRPRQLMRDVKRTPETDDRFWDDYAEMQEAEQEAAREFGHDAMNEEENDAY
jgi:hypothetical protein